MAGEMTVLVALENPSETKDLAEALERHGYQAHMAFDGVDAVRKSGSVKPGVVVLDRDLSVRDGIESLVAIRKNLKTFRTPVLMLVGDLETDREPAKAAGATAIIGKPYDLDVMLVKVWDLMPEALRC